MDTKPRVTRWAMTVSVAFAAAACGDRMLTEPDVAESSRAAMALASPGAAVKMLKRTERLESSLSTAGVIGPRGGHIEIGRAGVRIDFAAGAVAKPTRITMTALRGRNVAYRFEPHGLVFSAPVTVRQSLRNTVAWKNPEMAGQLQGTYFDRLLVDRTESFARSQERRPARLRETGRMLEFDIEHFSGYMVSVGDGRIDVSLDVEIILR